MMVPKIWTVLLACLMLLAAGCGGETAVSPTPTFPGPAFILFYTDN